jgi:branched-chain amino acid aminotransferase
MPSTNYAFVNGRFLPEDRAAVSIFDRGFLYGEGCFETMRIYAGRIFRPLEHFDRLFEGLHTIGLEPVFSPEELRAICRSLVQRNNLGDGVARVYVTRDSTVVTGQPREFQPRRLTAIVSTIRVNEQLARNKTANRLPYILAQREAEAAGVDDAVLLNTTGNVVEFTTSNVFAVKSGALFTPPLSDAPLPGVTRQAVIGLAGELRVPMCEQSFSPEFLETADEVFATNTLLEAAPVTNWSRRNAVTAQLQAAYRELVARELNTPAP